MRLSSSDNPPDKTGLTFVTFIPIVQSRFATPTVIQSELGHLSLPWLYRHGVVIASKAQ